MWEGSKHGATSKRGGLDERQAVGETERGRDCATL